MNKWRKLALAVDFAQTIKVALFDVDGVLFPAETKVSGRTAPRTRALYDGQGISILRAMGYRVAFITNEKGKHTKELRDVVRKWNNLPSSKDSPGHVGWDKVRFYVGRGGQSKIEAAQEFLDSKRYTLAHCSYMGDDLTDLKIMQEVGFPVAPAQAEETIRELAYFVTERPGGRGAIRDFAEFIAGVRGVNLRTLKFQ